MTLDVYVDIDGVTSKSYDYLIETYNRKYGTSFTKLDVTNYNLTHTTLGKKAMDIFEEIEFFTHQEPYEDYKALLKLINHDKVNLFFYTAASVQYKYYRLEWLSKHYSEIEDILEDICIFSSDKIAPSEGAILIDDYLPNIERFEETGGIGYLRVTNTGLYTEEELATVQRKVYSLEEFVDIVLDLAG